MTEPQFAWPDGFEPAQARLYVRNERRMRVPAAQVWSWLVAAPLWTSWFPNATNVRILSGSPARLERGSRFRWRQSGIPLDTVVREYVPNRRLGWFARSPFITAYHAWDIADDGDGVRVVTDETQRGLMPALLSPILKPRMLAVHDAWLERLDRQAAAGYAPSAG